jgi:hypothetical protein
MPLLHDITIYITKLSRASARYLSLCLLVHPIPFPAPQGHPYPTTFQLSATLLLFSGWVLCFSASPPDAAKPTLPQLNLHNTRVRRKPNGFLQVAVSNARNPTVLMGILPTRASDTALRVTRHNGLSPIDDGGRLSARLS